MLDNIIVEIVAHYLKSGLQSQIDYYSLNFPTKNIHMIKNWIVLLYINLIDDKISPQNLDNRSIKIKCMTLTGKGSSGEQVWRSVWRRFSITMSDIRVFTRLHKATKLDKQCLAVPAIVNNLLEFPSAVLLEKHPSMVYDVLRNTNIETWLRVTL